MKKKISIEELIHRAKNNDSKAQNLLMDFYWNDIKSYIFTLIKENNDAEDVTVLVFTKVFQKLDLYNSDFDFKNWVISIAHNSSIDFLRKKQRISHQLENYYHSKLNLEPIPSTEQDFIQQQDSETLTQLFSKLDDKYKEILRLKYVEDLSIKEIAAILSISESNTKIRIMRAKKFLEKLLE